jgi:hypothetical protein
MEVSGQLNAQVALPPGKEPQYPMEKKRRGRPRSRYGQYKEENNFLFSRESKLDSCTVQAVAVAY